MKIRYKPIDIDGIKAEMNLPRELLEITIEFKRVGERQYDIVKVGKDFVVKDEVLTTVDGYSQYHPKLGSILNFIPKMDKE